ncbi:hypothetical protein [Sphingobacterium kitahiroshimense]|uniref:Uncharacterized protein n=1 Tax=Sphingobacterium kitahiroshimense TaxID=470446 RepID=A0ABV0BP66_9SPHI
MNENNLGYLKKTLEGLGFGTKLNEVLENAIRREMPNFSLGITTRQKPLENSDRNAAKTEHLIFKFNFNRSKDSDMYFLNNYHVALHQKGNPIVRQQTFDLERDYRITALQAYKLLSGLSFEKEVYLRNKTAEGREPGRPQEKTSLWFKLNLDITDAYGNHPLRTFRPEYGYDIREALSKYPLKGLSTAEKIEEGVKALSNGNYFQDNLQIGKKNLPVSIAANPQMKTINIYDKDMVEIRDEVIFPEKARAKTTVSQPSPAQDRAASQAVQPEQPWVQEPELETGNKRGR